MTALRAGAQGAGTAVATGEGLVPVPGAVEIARALPETPPVPTETVQARIVDATTLARGFTRGAGFSTDGQWVDPGLADAISSCVTRSLLNPSLPLALAGPPLSSRPGTFATWSATELALLTRLRDLGGS